MLMDKYTLREMEETSRIMTLVLRRMFGIHKKISDNTIGAVLAGLDPREVVMMLWNQVRSMLHRKQLTPQKGLGIRTLAIDGKQIARDEKPMSQYAKKQEHSDGRQDYHLHVLRAVLTWTTEKLAVWQHAVGVKKNEITGAKEMLKELFSLDKYKRWFELITFDAMFMVYPLTKMIDEAGRYFLAPIKANQPDMYRDALSLADEKIATCSPDYTSPIEHDGHTYKQFEIYLAPEFAGWETSARTWSHLTQLIIVKLIKFDRVSGRGEDARVTKRERGESIRVYATNLPHGRLNAKQTLAVVRSHWSIENECFNSMDLQFNEDSLKVFVRGEGQLNRSLFMLMAYNLLQLARHQRPKVKWDGKVGMSWKKVFESFFIAFTTHYPKYLLAEAARWRL